MGKTQLSIVGLLIALAIFLSLNVIGSATLRSSRIDLTENQLYTLSDGTKNILSDLDQDITLYFYFSKKLADEVYPELSNYAQRVNELLDEYVEHSGGKIKLEVADPEPFSEAEDRAVGFGIRGLPANTAGEFLYVGLAATNETDEEEVVPFLDFRREEFLEYDLTKMVYSLSITEKPTVGLMSDLPLRGQFNPQNPQAPPVPWFIVETIEGTFDVQNVPTSSEEIPEEISILMLVHPKNLSKKAQFAVDQFVLRGGKLVCFVDPNCELEMPPPDPQNPMNALQAEVSSDLDELFANWGIELVDEKIAADMTSGSNVSYGGGRSKYIVWLTMNQDRFVEEDPISADLKSVVMATAGVLKPIDGSTTTVSPLIQTSENSSEVERMSVAFGRDPKALLDNFFSGEEELMLAARINGNVSTAFPDGPPKDEPAEGEEATEEEEEEAPTGDWLKESQGPINVVVVADVDMLYDQWWVRLQDLFGTRLAFPQADNGNFVVNVLDNLSGSNDLISLRSRGRFQRPFTKVTEIREKADDEFRAKEQELEAKLRETETRLNDLQRERPDGGSQILTAEQRTQIEEFKAERLKTRKELREVKHQQNKDIENLGNVLYAVNALGLAALIGLFAVARSLMGRQKQRR